MKWVEASKCLAPPIFFCTIFMIRIDSVPFDSQTMDLLLSVAIDQEHSKGAVLLKQGSFCQYLYLIDQGMLRLFFYDANGNEITHWFAAEGMLMTAPGSYFNQEPSFFCIQALEQTKLKAISFEDLEAIFGQSIKLEKLGRMYSTKIMLFLEHRLIDWQIKSAEARYLELLEAYPSIFQRAKLGHIASYLGITQQSLSRIRAKLNK